jgi:ArsR family transcriptional regulator, cadmium/lead-responsive transcriptional repressor
MTLLTARRSSSVGRSASALTTLSANSRVPAVGAALSDETRARILLELAGAPAYPGDLAAFLETTRSNVSSHLTCLRGCGLVRAVPEGRNVRYELSDERLAAAFADLARIAVAEHCDQCDGRQRRL